MGLPFIVVGAIIPTKDNSQLDDIISNDPELLELCALLCVVVMLQPISSSVKFYEDGDFIFPKDLLFQSTVMMVFHTILN